MTAVMEADIQTAPKSDISKRLNLTDDVLQQGAEILGSLATVERYLRYNDTTSAETVPLIARSVVQNDQPNDRFQRFIRRVAGFEYPDQRAVVEEILFVRRDYFDELCSRHEDGKPVLWVRPQAKGPGSSN